MLPHTPDFAAGKLSRSQKGMIAMWRQAIPIVLVLLLAPCCAQTRSYVTARRHRPEPMEAGFAKVKITPPIGTRMMGFGGRDMAHGCTGIHDDIYTRALYLRQGEREALIMSFDLCFIGRADSGRLKRAIRRRLRLRPEQILLNASHNHVSPAVGTWYGAPPQKEYLRQLGHAVVNAAVSARNSAREVTIWAGTTRSRLPVNRRWKSPEGDVQNRPNLEGPVYDAVPICLLKDKSGAPVCLVFSIAAHASMKGGWDISAEYPGAAMDRIDEYLGNEASMFLQGVAGDSKPRVIAAVDDDGVPYWRGASWDDVAEAGRIVAEEVIEAVEKGLKKVQPRLAYHLLEVKWPMQPPASRQSYEAAAESTNPVRRRWAEKILARLDTGRPLPASVPLLVQGIQIGRGLRIIGIEGEPLHAYGYLIAGFYGSGVTFPIGYCNGEGLYLPASDQIDEGGYEVVSYWEYGWPAPLAKGFEEILTQALERIRAQGVG